MYILIPPSECKNSYSDNEYFSLDSLSYDFLNNKRSQFFDYLRDNNLSKDKYLKIIGISNQNYEKISTINSKIETSQVVSSISRYTGVLYDYLDYPSLDENAKSILDESLIIFSGLFGLLRTQDLSLIHI